MIVLSTKRYTELVTEAALARAMAARVVALEEQREKLLDAVLALKMDGAEVPPGFGEDGFGKYTFDEVETAESGESVQPRPVLVDDEVDPEILAETAKALGFDH